MKKIMDFKVYNPSGNVRWSIVIMEEVKGENTRYLAMEDAENSLFDNPLAKGYTLPECIDNFFRNEPNLMANLGVEGFNTKRF